MNRFTVFAAVVASLTLSAAAWAAPIVHVSPIKAAPQVSAATVTVTRNGSSFSKTFGEGKTKLFGELGFDLYFVLSRGAVSLEIDPPFGVDPIPVKLAGGPKHYSTGDVDLDPLGRFRIDVDLLGS